MKICVFGAGAVGGFLAVELASAGYQVSAIARGANLDAIRAQGLMVMSGDEVKTARIQASDDPADLGPQDLVFCTLKAHQANESAHQFAPLLGPDTPVVAAVNGLPWWYFHRQGGTLDGQPVESADPQARLWHFIGPERAIGCVVDPICDVVSPGVIRQHGQRRFIVGEPDGSRSDRIASIAKVLTDAGFDVPIRDNIRWNVWNKLLGNACFNPLSMLSRLTLDRIAADPRLSQVCRSMMGEAKAISEALGIDLPEDAVEKRLKAAAAVSGHKMSMLRDLEGNHSLEIDALVGSIKELGQLVGVPTPTTDLVLDLARLCGREAGLYRDNNTLKT